MKPLRERALEHAIARLGVTEQPLGSNRGPLIDKWNRAANGLVGEPWCMSFIHGMYLELGVTLGGWAGVGNFESWARSHGYLVGRPRRGDIGCLDWNGDAWPDHAVIVERVLALRWRGSSFVGLIRYVAGNDGDRVQRRTRWVPSTSRFARVPG